MWKASRTLVPLEGLVIELLEIFPIIEINCCLFSRCHRHISVMFLVGGLCTSWFLTRSVILVVVSSGIELFDEIGRNAR